jgi:hypothetical protein
MPCPICQELMADLDRLGWIYFERRGNELAGKGKVSDLEQQRLHQAERLAKLDELDAQSKLAAHEREAHSAQRQFTASG